MSKFSKFIFIPILALLLCFSIVFVGCSNKNNPSNNSNSSNNNNVTPPQNINYLQELEKYMTKNGNYVSIDNSYIYRFVSSKNTTEYPNFEGDLDYYLNSHFKIIGHDTSKDISILLEIPLLTDYSGHKYTASGYADNFHAFSVSFTAENATVQFDSHDLPTGNPSKFQEYVQNIQNTLNTTMQAFSSYFSKKVLNSSDNMAYAKAFHFPTTVTITNTIQK